MRSIYILIKSLVAILDGIGVASLDLLQCRLLLTVFEVGHGMYPAAYISIGTVAREGIALGIHKLQSNMTEESNCRIEAEEGKSVWRGILVLDR
jgi:hypothetical protein